MPYHLSVKVVSRGKGHSMIAKAAYNSRTAILEERTGEMKDYSRHKDKPLASFVFTSDPELRDAGKLWNFYDAQETRSNAQLGYSFPAALPHQLTDEQRAFIVKDFMREQFLRKDVAAQADIHRPDRHGDARNFHVHVLVSMRKVSSDGLGEKVFTWHDKEKNLAQWRRAWADRCARELEKIGDTLWAERWRWEYLANEQQREKALERGDLEWAEHKAREATKHLGPKASAMERRGEQSDLGDINRAAQDINNKRDELKKLDAEIAAEQEKLASPPKTPEDARERYEDMTDALTRTGQRPRKGRGPMKNDRYRLWRRAISRRSSYDAAAAYERYVREHIWGDIEQEHERGGLER